ncbi:MAG: hypothetical protein AAGC46_01105 [Solirubrobacteraceae bacterium]|nr:hypothetical protein [Patulibacter sp.]
MGENATGPRPIRELVTSDANVLNGLWLVAAAAFDLVWLLLTAVAISSFPKALAVAVAAVVFLGSVLYQVLAARRPGISYDEDTVWWRTGLNTLHHVPREQVRFGVHRRFGIERATVADGDGPSALVPRLAVITWTQPAATVAVRELDPDTGKPRPWVDLGLRWTQLHERVLEQTLDDQDAITEAIAAAQTA